MNKIIYKSPQGATQVLSYDDPVDIPNVKICTFPTMTKDKLYLSLHKAFNLGVIPILYDQNIHSIKPRIESLNLETLPEDTSIVFFTSGTTGEPTGALKSKQNIMKELETLTNLFAPYDFERVIVTVPLIHIYGFLAGVMLPQALGVDVVLKEEFLPHELLELAEDKRTLCITNPVFLKVLNKLSHKKKYNNITFLSSTGKLDAHIAKELNEKIACTIYQLFGSTETGGIAYKVNDEELWKPLSGVEVASDNKHLSVQSPYVSTYIIEKNLIEIKQPFVTSDIIEMQYNKFKLLGRESEIIKISGKRISLLEVENLLEKSEFIEEALVRLAYDVGSHKDEQLNIDLISSLEMTSVIVLVKKILQENYKKINIRTNLQLVKFIKKNHMGKKIRK